LHKSPKEIGIFLPAIGISLREIHKWAKEIPISLEEIGISPRKIPISFSDLT